MVFPQIELLQRKIILVSGYERLLAERDSGDGQSGAATERHKLEDAARRNGDAVAFGFVKGAWIPAAQAISWSGWPCPAAVLEMAAYPLTLDTHSLRRTKAVLINGRTGSQRAVQLLLGHSKIESTVRYLGIEVDDAIEIVEKTDIGTSWAGSSGPARHADAMPHIPDVVGGTLYVAD